MREVHFFISFSFQHVPLLLLARRDKSRDNGTRRIVVSLASCSREEENTLGDQSERGDFRVLVIVVIARIQIREMTSPSISLNKRTFRVVDM